MISKNTIIKIEHMGEMKVKSLSEGVDKTNYIKQLLSDIGALEQMLERGMFEKSLIRIGAEQEFCMVDKDWEPTDKAIEVLKEISDPHFTTELALYNLEINLDPLVLTANCFSELHRQLDGLLAKARKAAELYDLKIILTGILPTIAYKHLETAYMTPTDRFKVLDNIVRELRGDEIELHIKGVDEINLHHDTILFEGCNTSFQSHLQIDPNDFADAYNWAQAIAGPVLAIAANAPLLMGRELWQETRIALFTQSVDSRASTHLLNEKEARVEFGSDWAKGSVVDYYKNNIVRFKSLLTTDFGADSLSELGTGKVPKLRALGLHNGTVYQWNRVCYGMSDEKPHIRIENRYMPSGPTSTDEIANMMFWVGVMRGRPKAYDAIHTKMEFKDVKSNFYNAARYGTAAQFYWDGNLVSCKDLLRDQLLPMAYRGLYAMGVAPEDAERYLSVIENRIKTQNGARWMVLGYRKLKTKFKTTDALQLLTAELYEHERKGYTVDAWELPRGKQITWDTGTRKVKQIMNTYTITAQEDDNADLIVKMMQWKNIHHMPILNNRQDLVGLLTWTDVTPYFDHPTIMASSIKALMKKELVTITGEKTVREARLLMESKKINCLPVLHDKKLLGIITSKDV